VQGARIAGAARIVAADPRPERRERALTLGASEALEPGEVAEVFDYAFDAVGGAGTFELALRATRAGGTTVAVGMAAAGVRYELDPAQLTNEEKTLTGSLYGSEDPAVALPLALEYVRSGRLDLEGALGPIYPLERVNEAIKASMTEAAGRVLVTMADS
jgi:S-(hydroxymethyl)glutathione dehydrogenase/alcohol dehydrogenase